MFRRFAALFTPLLVLAACSSESSTSSPPAPEVGVVKSNLVVDETVSLTASKLTPTDGETVNFVAKAPVVNDPAVISQTITGTWDSHFQLSGPPTFPENWTLSYFAGLTQLGATPTTPAGWASVTSISATGSYQSDGSLNGVQYVVGNTSPAAPPPATSFSGGSQGDGWNVFFSPDRTKVYNVHHHDGPATVMCRKASDGSTCSAGWPFALYHTSFRSTGWIDPKTLHLWHETYDPQGRGGWECVDTSGPTPSNCATRFVPAFTGANDYNHHIDLQNVGRELYSMDSLHSALTCLDLDANNGAGGPCAGQPYAGFGGDNIENSGIRAINGKIYVLANNQIKCFDPATKAACTGMSWPQAGLTQPILPVPSSDGIVRNLCTLQTCYALDGGAHTLPSTYINYIASHGADSCCGRVFNGMESAGTKVFFPYQGYLADCFDMSTGLECPGFPIQVNSIYATVIDPLNANCLWTNGDDGIIRTWNVPDGASGCSSPPPLSSFKAALAVPRLACGDNPTITAWDTFTLTNPPSTGFTSATVTVKDANGTAIQGWINVALNGNHPLDISSLNIAQTGQAPSFEVTYLNLTNTSAASAKLRVLGQSPEMCWSAAATAACPSGPGLLLPPLPATSATQVVGSGSITLPSQPVSPFLSTTVNITAPNLTDSAVCGATIAGTLGGPSNIPVKGATVELLSATGNPVLDESSAPIVATSANDGTYSFPTLLIGTYKVRVKTVPDHWTISAATVATGGTGTTNAASGEVVSNPITLTGSLTGQVNADFIGPIDSDGDGVPDYVEKGEDPNNPIDLDGDGVADYLDLDADNDGILDKTERGNNGDVPRDTDNDGKPDYLDLDSDGDGIPDAYEANPGITLTESGAIAGLIDATNGIPVAVETAPGSGLLNYTASDYNQDGTPDYLSLDSDGDGVADSAERGATGAPVDTDGDDQPDYLDPDSDGDGISDAIESDGNGALVDTDEDGTPDRLDLDSDDDGIPDREESASDPDDDDIGNYRDPDSDNDGVSDKLEGAADPDDDGKPNYLDEDSDEDGVPDSVEQGDREELLDTDEDGIPDYHDEDSDGDGIPDSVEVGSDGEHPRDSDGDQIPDYLDDDSDGDGIPDAIEKGTDGLADTDQDGVPDYRDTDSDNDGVKDSIEAGEEPGDPRDADGDGIPDYLDEDSDDDGIPDSAERGGSSTPVDSDGDGIPDMIDTDSDGDGILDITEGTDDPDHDNIPSYRDEDSDGDLVPDAQETDGDDDGDGVPNYRDGDSDGDGVRDVLEVGTDPAHPRDSDGDGVPDYLDTDTDNDCLPDKFESVSGLMSANSPNSTPSENCTDPDNPRCDTTRGLCTHGCAVDTDCGNASSGSICDENTHGCAPGCRDGSNQCEGSEVCSAKNGGPGKCLVDTDGDGIPDEVEEQKGLNPNTDDSDGDGIPDSVEAPGGALVDTDHDGIPDVLDTDADGDGIADKLEIGSDPLHPRDTDHDGIPDYLDLDTDGDGWPDATEKSGDTDGDGIPDYLDTDSDGDGVSDADEFAWGLARGKTDSDGDGISDGDEVGPGPGALDTDEDGRPDAIDLDADNDSLPDSFERGGDAGPADLDSDGIPDYRDLDADNDGIPDAVEARDKSDQYADTDGDGEYDYRDSDSDGDGLSDESEGSSDTDGDGLGNWRDPDSDNDCVSDSAEAEDGTQLDPEKPSELPSDNCPAEAPICGPSAGTCITAERTPPRECNADNAANVCLSGECDAATGKCVPVGCTADASCGTGMYCDGNTMTCVMQLSAGAKLGSDVLHGGTCTAEIAAQMCASGVCNPYSNECAKADGESCKLPVECASNACLDGACVSSKQAPTVNRLSGGCSALNGATSDNSWTLLGVLAGIALGLRRPRRRGTRP